MVGALAQLHGDVMTVAVTVVTAAHLRSCMRILSMRERLDVPAIALSTSMFFDRMFEYLTGRRVTARNGRSQ